VTSYEFMTVLRGYDPEAVDEFLTRITRAIKAGSPRARAQAADALREVEFPTALRGYDRAQVDAVITQLQYQLGLEVEPLPVVQFDIVLSGYEIGAVDQLFAAALAALASTDARERAKAAAVLRDTTFRIKLRGYDRGQVDMMLQRFARELAAW